MKRKIAAIFAADIAGYSRLVAEDEEETLRRLASYRAVMDDFIARAGGRIFNTAGDAVLAEFSSAVEAVRCAIDIQESLRTRNLAYPPSRQMSFRIGITVGDVVERDGDLLGDGVNIAARLEGIAPVGGICISRTVHEQVANKLSVQFADIGEQQVKNIPTPVHAFKIEMRSEDAGVEAKPSGRGKAAASLRSGLLALAAGGAVAVAAIAAIAFVMLGKSSAPPPSPPVQALAQRETPPSPPAAPPAAETVVPETIPFIPDRIRGVVRNEYLPGADHKALAISTGPIGLSVGQADDDTAKAVALDACQKRADALNPPRKCELYAVGSNVVYGHGRPPLPPPPWVRHDASVETPFASTAVPLIRDPAKAAVERGYSSARAPKALAISPLGAFFYYTAQETDDEAARRVLEFCGGTAGVPCLIVAMDNKFVVPIPATAKVSGFFHAATEPAIAPERRADVASRLANATGWTAVAAGNGGQVGVTLEAANEQSAVDGALADCAKLDRACRVIAIGPFAVEAK